MSVVGYVVRGKTINARTGAVIDDLFDTDIISDKNVAVMCALRLLDGILLRDGEAGLPEEAFEVGFWALSNGDPCFLECRTAPPAVKRRIACYVEEIRE